MANSKGKVKGIPRVTAYQALANFADLVVASMTGNLNFATPIPLLATLTTAAAAVNTYIAAWGPPGARGSHENLLKLRASALTLRNLLVQEAAYVQNIIDPTLAYADQVEIIETSGFSVKNAPTPQGVLAAPQNPHQMFAANVPITSAKIKWKKPIGVTSPGNVKSYTIARNTTNITPVDADFIGTSTKTSFIDVFAPIATNTPLFYFIRGNNDAGPGVWSASVHVTSV